MNEKLTKREIGLIKQGKLIVSNEQLAVCYLVAKYSINNKIPNFIIKGTTNFSIYSGMNPETYRRCIEKFKLLFLNLDSDEEETRKEMLYPKLINSYNTFNEMKEEDVYNLAHISFTEDNEQIGKFMYEQHLENQSKYTEQAKKKSKLIIQKVTLLYKSLYSVYKDSSKSKKQAINKISKELDINVENIYNICAKDQFLKTIH